MARPARPTRPKTSRPATTKAVTEEPSPTKRTRKKPASSESSVSHAWTFTARFRKHAFGWRSQPAITRVREAVAEIRKVAKKEPALAGEGAVTFFERVSPAIEHVDGSSGSMSAAVHAAIGALVPIIGAAPVDASTREDWLTRVLQAIDADGMAYIESLAESFGELCGSEAIASAWADRLIELARVALQPGEGIRAHRASTSACLSALYRASRYDELVDVLEPETFWTYKRWAVKALAARGDTDAAVRLAESCRSPWASHASIDALCEEILLAAGRIEEAYASYGARASQRGTYLATFRAVQQKYPHKAAAEILAHLLESTPGDEGKWFAAAKDAGLHDEALVIARRSPCDPRTLTRAADDHVESHPAFALGAALAALHWLLLGHGYDITSADVWAPYRAALRAAEQAGLAADVKARIRAMVAAEPLGQRFVTRVLGKELGL